MGRHKAKPPRRFGMAHGKHSQRRKERVQEAKVGRKSFKYKCERQENNKITLKVQQGIRRRKSRFLKKRGIKRYYQLYRSPFTGQLKKRVVSKLFDSTASGYRLVNLASLQKYVGEISLHSASCKAALEYVSSNGQSPIVLISEIDNYGLASILSAKCMGCHREINFETSPRLRIDTTSRHFDINVRAVWGSLVTGNGQAPLNEFLACTDSPGLNQKTFTKIESDINSWWNEQLQHNLKKAIEAEKEIAISKGNFHEGKH